MTPFQAAEALADACVPSFACGPDKAPLTRHGHLDATVDHAPAAWAGAALVGVPTGEASGWDILDIDVKGGGLDWLAANEHRLPASRRVSTRSGGVHVYFRARADMRCSVGRVAPGVDIRSAGGFVIDWAAAGFPVQHPGVLAEWPAWLADAARGPRVRHADNPERSNADLAPPSAEAAVALLDRLPNPAEASRDDYLAVMLAAKGCIDGLDGDGEDDIAEAAIGWAARWPGSPGYDAESEKWSADFATRTAPLAGWQSLLAVAYRLGADTTGERIAAAADDFAHVAVAPEPPAPVPARLRMLDRLLRPADCETGPRRGYIVKHLIAPGDVGAIVGAPGAGKSTLAPFLAYAVAQGRAVFGMRTKPGNVLYAAAEDFSGMRQRVHALKRLHADAPGFALVDCGNLLDADAAAELLEVVRIEQSALVVIDTVGAAWAGIDENDSAGMGAVVATARRIAATGAAVLLIHHTAKNGDGTPRGHSALNGTLDMCLSLSPLDDNRIVRGKLTKNRNGSCDREITFRSDAHTIGQDEDGDEITAPVAAELAAPAGPKMPVLSPREQRALDILNDIDVGEGVSDAVWFDACEQTGLVASESAANRRKVARQILQKLLDKRAITAAGGVLRSNRRNSLGTSGNSLEQRGTAVGFVPRNSGTAGTATLKGCSAVPPGNQDGRNVAEGLI